MELQPQAQPTVIRFFAEVNGPSITALLNTVDQKMREGVNEFVLLISTTGGTVFHGLTAYNVLQGTPAKFTTHNIGSVDSIGVTLFCAGSTRLSVPTARFLLHEISLEISARVDERIIRNHLKGLQVDTRNVAGVVAAHTGKSVSDVVRAMNANTVLGPVEAVKWGLVDSIETELFPAGSELLVIQ